MVCYIAHTLKEKHILCRLAFLLVQFLVVLSWNDNTLSCQIPFQISQQFKLLIHRQSADNSLQNAADSNVMFTNQAAVIYVYENSHQEPCPYVSMSCQLYGFGQPLTGSPSDPSCLHDQECCVQNP